MPLQIAEYYPEGLAPDAAPVEHAGPVPFLRSPLTPEAARSLACALRDRAAELRGRDRLRLHRGLERLHAAWAAVRSPHRAEAVASLHQATGYPEAVIDRHLRKSFAKLRAETARYADALLGQGPELVVVVSSGNIPGAALPSVAQALLLQSPCLVKCSSAEPFLLPLYGRSLAEYVPEAARSLAVTGWEGGDAALETALLSEADALIAYGGDAALAALRSGLPAHARFIGHGHRISFSAIARECLTASAAKRFATGVALDAAVFDQQGCLSPQAVYVERGGEVSPEAFAELLAGQMARLERIIPRRRLAPAEASAIHQYRAGVEMRAFSQPAVRIWSSPDGTAWTVALEEDPELRPCPLNRTVVLRPLEQIGRLPEHLPERGNQLLSVGLAAEGEAHDSLAAALVERGVTRVTRIGHAQRPIDFLHHDGVDAMKALTRYAAVER